MADNQWLASYTETLYLRAIQTTARAKAPAHEEHLQYALVSATIPTTATVNGVPLTEIGSTRPLTYATKKQRDLNYYDAASAAYDWYYGGVLLGGAFGCLGGGIVGGITGALLSGPGAAPAAVLGCMESAEAGAVYGSGIGIAIGFELGGNGDSHAGAFEWGADQAGPLPWDH